MPRKSFAVTILLAAAVFVPASLARAQLPFEVLYTFPRPGLVNPASALIQATDGNFYGTSKAVRPGNPGTAYRMTPDGTVTVLHVFTGLAGEGYDPQAALIQATDGTFFGTTAGGGTYGAGTVFAMTIEGAVTTRHSFDGGAGGSAPLAALMQAADGQFYGTTSGGGENGRGTVFTMTFGGTVTVRHAFTDEEGSYPTTGVIEANDGSFYGTVGVAVFRMTPTGSVTVLHRFSSASPFCGRPAGALLQAADGNFYATIFHTFCRALPPPDGGSIFTMTPVGAVTILHTFDDLTSGATSAAALMQASDGSLYGTTRYSSEFGNTGGGGTLFKLTPDGTLSVVHEFVAATEGAGPKGALIQAADGHLYGTAMNGGPSNLGTIFKTNLAGSVSVLYASTGTDAGYAPTAALMQARDGDFYGTTVSGGARNLGTVFKMTPAGTVSTLHAFTGADGDGAYAPLIQASDGNFYGTTGGPTADGSLFRMTTDGAMSILGQPFLAAPNIRGTAVPAVLQGGDGTLYGVAKGRSQTNSGYFGIYTPFRTDLNGNGLPWIFSSFPSPTSCGFLVTNESPISAFIQATDGNFYAGRAGGGVVRITPEGLCAFFLTVGASTDVTGRAALIQAGDGSLYGTTYDGGASNRGTVFRMTLDGTVSILHAFPGGAGGANPTAALLQGRDGDFYGTTKNGGADGAGTVFKMTPAGAITILHSFTGGTDGAQPVAALIQVDEGSFYGTTQAGGTSGTGVIFRFKLPVSPGTDLAIDFGPAGLWGYDNRDAYAPLHHLSPEEIAVGDLDGNGKAEAIIDFPGHGVWVWANNAGWYRLHAVNAAAIVTGDLDGNGQADVLIDFPGHGLWVWLNNTGWYRLHPQSPSRLVTADLDGNGKAEAIIDFPGHGVWVWANNTSWSQLHQRNTAALVAGDFDGSGTADLLLDFPGSGLWVWSNNALWFQLHPGDATVMATGDIDGNGKAEAIISFPGYGVWVWVNNTAWRQLHTVDAALITAADIDGNGKADVIISFPGYGLWAWMNNARWSLLHAQNPESLTAGNLDGT